MVKLVQLTLASLSSSRVSLSNKLIISIFENASSTSYPLKTSKSLDDQYVPVLAFVYLQGGIFLDFESHGQLRCCLLHRHLGFVVFLWLFVFFFYRLRMAIVHTTAIWWDGVRTVWGDAFFKIFLDAFFIWSGSKLTAFVNSRWSNCYLQSRCCWQNNIATKCN